ncbi:MAG: pyruvate:ferredoxin (flavodoxin) oxidoreductase, partial [Clostridia bacterium]
MKKWITVDGNTAVSNIAYLLSEQAIIYPITPSSPMAENIDEWQSKGKKNIFGMETSVTEMQSEAGVSGALHGALTTGSLATTFTSSQGLLLMLPNMYKIAGENLPCVIHVSARTVATHALSIFGDHSDVMSALPTGFCFLASASVQEAQDMAVIAHIASLKTSLPFVHFFDGFRTSHEINKIEEISEETLKELYDYSAMNKFKSSALSSLSPVCRGTSQNQDTYFQCREACQPLYSNAFKIIDNTFKDFYKKTGRKYSSFEYIGSPTAENIIVCMGSSTETTEETINYLNAHGFSYGLIKVRLLRPFSAVNFAKVIPTSAKTLIVLDRTKEAGAVGEPLYREISTAVVEEHLHLSLLSGRYGLASKEFTPSMVLAIFKNAEKASPKNHFTVGIDDDVSSSSLSVTKHICTLPESTRECKFFGLGNDGTISATKSTIKIIGEETDLFVQGYFVYDSKKSGNITISHMRASKDKIQSAYLTENLDFIACHNSSYLTKFDVLKHINKNAIFLLNAPWSARELERELPPEVKQTLANNNITFALIDAGKLAHEVGLGNKINLIMQTAFFALSGIIEKNEAILKIKEFAKTAYSKKGAEVLLKNNIAIDKTLSALQIISIPEKWKTETSGAKMKSTSSNDIVTENILKVLALEGDNLKVSAFSSNGEVRTGTTALEKRDISTILPCWNSSACIQCNQCSLVCPHACLRPTLTEHGSELSTMLGSVKALGIAKKDYALVLSPKDCTGCGLCAGVCPARNKAIIMTDKEKIEKDAEKKWRAIQHHENPIISSNKFTVKNSQFEKPLFEFSGACAGCGETPYIKLLTQLFGEKLVIANATGCSSIYGGSSPTCPYTKKLNGRGTAWSNSLFEDNAEFSLGMLLGIEKNEQKLTGLMQEVAKMNDNLSALAKVWLDKNNRTNELASKIISIIKNSSNELYQDILALAPSLTSQIVFAVGGDGWAYDIGYGGIDHVLSSDKNVNILVLDTEMYSNTGGQISKSSPMGTCSKFAVNGKTTHKKNMGEICMLYPN